MSEQRLLQMLKNLSMEGKKNLKQLFANDSKQEKTIVKVLQPIQNLFQKIAIPFTVQKARQASKNQRNLKLLDALEYNYGEIYFQSIYQIFLRIRKNRKLTKNEVFYDLGSGSGKVIFAASLCFPFKKCVGIQLLQSLYANSLELKQKILSSKQQIENLVTQSYDENYELPEIQFKNADFKDYKWNDGTIIFVSSTCYGNGTMNDITQLSSSMKIGTIFITLTKKLDDQDHWKVIQSFNGQTSWGKVTIYIQQKIA